MRNNIVTFYVHIINEKQKEHPSYMKKIEIISINTSLQYSIFTQFFVKFSKLSVIKKKTQTRKKNIIFHSINSILRSQALISPNENPLTTFTSGIFMYENVTFIELRLYKNIQPTY